jgi:hypothetical protein
MKIRFALAALLLSLSATGLRAQAPLYTYELSDPQNLRLFEFEFGFGVNIPRSWPALEKTRMGTNFLLELRLNRPRFFDVGLQFKGSNFSHHTPGDLSVKSQVLRPSLFVDYNYRPSQTLTFFAGAGFGGSFAQDQTTVPIGANSGLLFDGRDRAFAVTPRVGVVAMNGLRITAEYVFTARDYSAFNLNVGVVVSGGSYKKSLRAKRRSL